MQLLLSMLGGLGGSGGLGGIMSMGSSLFGTLFSGISTLVSGIGTLVRGAVGLFVGAVSTFVNVLRSSINTLVEFSKTVSTISNQTGMGTGQALGLTNRFRALGMSPDETAKVFNSPNMNPEMYNLRARTVGAPLLGSPNFEVETAKWYQSIKSQGTGGLFNAQNLAKTLFAGNLTPALLGVLNTKPETMQKELNYNSNLQSKLGLSPEIIQRASEDLPLLINRIYMFIDAVKMRFAGELLPVLEMVFNMASQLMLKASGGIANAIRVFAHWMYVEMPDLAVKGLNTLIDSAYQITEVFFRIGDGIVALMRALDDGKGGLYAILSGFAEIFDFIRDSITDLLAGTAFMARVITNQMIGDPFGLWKKIGIDKGYVDPMEDVKDVNDARPRGYYQGELAKMVKSSGLGGAADKLESGLKDARKTRDKVVNIARGWADSASKMTGTKAEREAEFAKFAQNIVDATKEGSQNVVDAIHGNAPGSHDLTGQAIGHVLASYALRTRRRG